MSLAVQLQDTGNVLAFLGSAFIVADVVMYFRHDQRPMLEETAWGLFVIANILYGIGSLLRADWPGAAVSFACAAFFAWLLWRRWRKHRKRAAALLGAKSRALRDALVRKQRELTRPRPVLRPVPQGGAG